MLLHKLMQNGYGKGREVIGLIGTHHGVGVTHTGLMLAFYMGEERLRKTALLECNPHGDYGRIREAYEWSREDGHSFSFHRITCYGDVNEAAIAGIFSEDYECLILDFGTDFSANREEFLRCGTKIIIGGRSQWDIPKLTAFTEASKAVRGNDSWLCFITQANEGRAKKISREIGRKVYPVPRSEEPTLPTLITNQFFERIFR